jgi:hypothetical protein
MQLLGDRGEKASEMVPGALSISSYLVFRLVGFLRLRLSLDSCASICIIRSEAYRPAIGFHSVGNKIRADLM